MKQKLFPNLKNLRMVFCIAVVAMTVFFLLLRLLFFGGASSQVPDIDPNTGQVTYDVELSDKITFQNVDATADLKVKYSKNYEEPILLKIIRNDDQKEIFRQQLTPGERTIKVLLTRKDMPKGTYSCTVEITVLDPITLAPLDTLTRNLTVVIKDDLLA